MSFNQEGGGGGVDLEGFFAKQELARKQQEELKKKIDSIDQEVKQIGKNMGDLCSLYPELCKLPEKIAATKSKTLDEYSPQERYNSIKNGAPAALKDLDNIYVAKFQDDPAFRKFLLETVCPDGECRSDSKRMIEEWEAKQNPKEKKLFGK